MPHAAGLKKPDLRDLPAEKPGTGVQDLPAEKPGTGLQDLL